MLAAFPDFMGSSAQPPVLRGFVGNVVCCVSNASKSSSSEFLRDDVVVVVGDVSGIWIVVGPAASVVDGIDDSVAAAAARRPFLAD